MTAAWRFRGRNGTLALLSAVLVNPETRIPFELYPEEERFIRIAFTATAAGRLSFAESLFAAPKKSGTTALTAMLVIYVTCDLCGGTLRQHVLTALRNGGKHLNHKFTCVGE
jgi:hypothetical protein